MYVLTRESSQYIDREVPKRFDVPLDILMENAGRGISDVICYEYGARLANTGECVLFLCGTGNNGADGLVAARHLKEQGIAVRIVIEGESEFGSELFKKQLSILESIGVETESYEDFHDWAQTAIVVEGLSGTGFSAPMKEETARILHDLDIRRTEFGFHIMAIDVPAGVDATTGHAFEGAITCDWTVTFGAIKAGLLFYPGKTLGGTTVVVPLGVPWSEFLERGPEEFENYTIDRDIAELIIHERSPKAHKGINGHTLIIGGSKTMTGAPVLSAEAAVHSGAGKTSLAVPGEIQSVIQSAVIPEIMVHEYNDTLVLESLLEGHQSVVIGPGMGRAPEVTSVATHCIHAVTVPLLIDADALYALGTVGRVKKTSSSEGGEFLDYEAVVDLPHCIMTPHLGEFSRLVDLPVSYIERHYLSLARQFSTAHDVILVLKGIPTIVAIPDGRLYINTAGNSGMGSGGMGDVLSGIIGGFVSQGYAMSDAAILGVFIHSYSADRLADEKPWGYTASDVSRQTGLTIGALLKGQDDESDL